MGNVLLSAHDKIQQKYYLKFQKLNLPISVIQFTMTETLNAPYEYKIKFSSIDHSLVAEQFLNQRVEFAIFTDFDAKQLIFDNEGSGAVPQSSHLLRNTYGIITQFERHSTSRDETHYLIVLKPQLALLDNTYNNAIYQQMSVMEVVSEILKEHGFLNAFFLDKTTQNYPKRDFYCQWQESDLAFIQRITAEVGIWFYFEMHETVSNEVIHFCDNNQSLLFGTTLPYVNPSQMNDDHQSSVWAITSRDKVIPKKIRLKSYAYINPNDPLLVESKESDNIESHINREGQPYFYDEYYATQGAQITPQSESGQFYADLRHEHFLNSQTHIVGHTNCYHLTPGTQLNITHYNDATFSGIDTKSVIITRVLSQPVGRNSHFELIFEAIPYSPDFNYRPSFIPRPQISGTIPAIVSSRTANDTYSWIDKHGRYRVKFKFDLNTSWKKGFESLWVRLAKPYAGDTYGFHFPLTDGTEVAIAFEQGDPDRPYIAYAMHNFEKADHVTNDNHTRNVIRTPTNNKIRMEDKRGSEHIKVATEYGKTQLNLGHLVNQHREKRGEGFELRTDEWGALRAGKGLFISTDDRKHASSTQLDMDETKARLELALLQMEALTQLAEKAQADVADIERQRHILASDLLNLQSAVLIASAPKSIALTSEEDVQLSASKNITLTSSEQINLGAIKAITAVAGKTMSFFSHLGAKFFSAIGHIDIQAQGGNVSTYSAKDTYLASGQKMLVSAKDELTLVCQGAYIKLSGGNIELGAPNDIILKSNNLNKMGPASLASAFKQFDTTSFEQKYVIVSDLTKKPIANQKYKVEFSDGRTLEGITAENGETDLLTSQMLEVITIHLLNN